MVKLIPKSILSPQIAVRNVWARTLALSGKEALQTNNESNQAKSQMNAILKNAQSFKEIRYVNEVYSAIESTFRNLATARNHFSLNVKEVEERRTKRAADYEHLTTVSSDLASLIPRISSLTFGGAALTGVALTGWDFLRNYIQMIFPNWDNVDTILVPLLAIIGAGLGYLLHNLIYVPWKLKKVQKEMIKTDYDKIMYYKFYNMRVQIALKKLYDTTNSLYKDIFNSGDYPNLELVDIFIDDVLASMDMEALICEHISNHVCDKKKNIDADTWVRCETGIRKEKCEYYPKKP